MAAAISASIGLPVAKGLIQKALRHAGLSGRVFWMCGRSWMKERFFGKNRRYPGSWNWMTGSSGRRAGQSQEGAGRGAGLQRIFKDSAFGGDEEKQVMRGMDMVEYSYAGKGKGIFQAGYCIGQLEAQARAEGGGIRLSVSPRLWIWRVSREGRYQSMLFPEQHRYAKRKPRTRSLRKPFCAAPMSRPGSFGKSMFLCFSFQGKPDGGGGGSAAALFPGASYADRYAEYLCGTGQGQPVLWIPVRESWGMYAYTAGEEKGTLTDAACRPMRPAG